jgi:hypothetical protein
MSSKALSQRSYFSNSYKQGRVKFLDLCTAKNLAVQSFIHPGHTGPSGEDLAMDCVWIGNKAAKKVLLITCGTHGLEAATGAATILQFLESELWGQLKPDMAVLIVHAVNPYGWAHDRRGNEEGIDLNRNCLDHKQPYPDNPAYDDLHNLIKTADVDAQGLKAFAQAFHNYGKAKGITQAINGITAGQYTYPDGMSYGGQSLSWSHKTLFNIARHRLKQAKKIIHIDWHTGIGDFGEPFFIIEDPTSSPEYKLAESWWPTHTLHTEDILADRSPSYTGLLVTGLRGEIASINAAKIVSLVVEWGTYDLDNMLQALLMDDWLKSQKSNENPFAQTVREQLKERFYPSAPEWRQAVLNKAGPIYRQALMGLANW